MRENERDEVVVGMLPERVVRYGSPWLTPREAGLYARCDPNLIVRMIHNGRLRAYWGPGDSKDSKKRKRLVNKADIDDMICARLIEPDPKAVMLADYRESVGAA